MKLNPSAHLDAFARDNLPPFDQWPEMPIALPELHYPDQFNAASILDERQRLADATTPEPRAQDNKEQ